MFAYLQRLLYRYSKRHSRRHLYEWLDEAIREHCAATPCRTLNIGSGGDIAAVLHAAGVVPVSVDIDPDRNPDFVMSATDMHEFAESSFDVVFLLEVLEHIPQPDRAVSEILRVLKPGGVLIGSTPFLLGIHDAPHDYFRFTGHGLDYLFRRFEQVTRMNRNGYFDSIHVLCLRPLVVGSPRQIRLATCLFPLLLLMGAVFWVMERLFPRNDGTTGYFFVFRAPVE